LTRLGQAGFQVVPWVHFSRHLAVGRDGFVALLEPTATGLKVFGQVGYRIGDGIGMLVDRGEEKAFVWHTESVTATTELLAAYEQVKAALREALEGAVQ